MGFEFETVLPLLLCFILVFIRFFSFSALRAIATALNIFSGMLGDILAPLTIRYHHANKGGAITRLRGIRKFTQSMELGANSHLAERER